MFKRLLDILVSASALLIAWPFLIIIALLVRMKLGAPILFKQNRPGKNGKAFKMLKFRSMTDEKDDSGALLSDEHRLPAFGKLLRASSIDELPGLINVLRGEMSLVGPRPLLMEYLPLYNLRQNRRHQVRPGITGWAQVNGRNTLSWERKFEFDAWYVDNQSFWLDMRILFMTVKKVLKRADINQDGQVTMSKFSGSPVEEKSLE